MAVFARTFTGNFAVKEAELIALREGLEFAVRLNFQLEAAEIDSLSIVQDLESDFTFSSLAELLHDVSALIHTLCRAPCQYIPREGNCVAHELASASFALSNSFWTNCIPIFLSPHIRGDLSQ
ncbi:RNase H domain-containing protein [Forsythia ovata]|uniref:RNase H domain-containing protein n=1 Tax=Forsythia ovata TaxID=205694 RepID=A0ABD1WZA5_9LAMI